MRVRISCFFKTLRGNLGYIIGVAVLTLFVIGMMEFFRITMVLPLNVKKGVVFSWNGTVVEKVPFEYLNQPESLLKVPFSKLYKYTYYDLKIFKRSLVKNGFSDVKITALFLQNPQFASVCIPVLRYKLEMNISIIDLNKKYPPLLDIDVEDLGEFLSFAASKEFVVPIFLFGEFTAIQADYFTISFLEENAEVLVELFRSLNPEYSKKRNVESIKKYLVYASKKVKNYIRRKRLLHKLYRKDIDSIRYRINIERKNYSWVFKHNKLLNLFEMIIVLGVVIVIVIYILKFCKNGENNNYYS